MQTTSAAYRAEQKGVLRNENYVYVYLGVFSREAQANALAEGTYTVFSSPQDIFGKTKFEAYYATNEENFARVDGSQYFMPYDSRAFALYQGAVTEKPVDDIVISFGEYKQLRIKGLTIDFGEYYPTSFMVSNGWAEYTYIYENDKPGIWTTDDEFLESQWIWIVPFSMVGGKQRLRVLNISFGRGFMFDNKTLISTSWKSQVAHLSDSLPSKSFSFTIDNLDRKFSADNPHSYVAFLQEQQEVEFEYGRMLDDGTIFRMPGGRMSLKSWSSNDMQAKFTAVGKMDYVTSTYNKGKYYPEGISLYDLAQEICVDAGFTSFTIDSYLKKIFTRNPLPVEKHKALLQLIANASRSILRETRNGFIDISTSFMPSIVSISDNGHTIESDSSHILESNPPTIEYATTEYCFTYVDGHQYFNTTDDSKRLHTGYVSKAVADRGYFWEYDQNHVRFLAKVPPYPDGDDLEIKPIVLKYNNRETTEGMFVSGEYEVTLNEDGVYYPFLKIEWEASWTFYNMIVYFSDVYPYKFEVYTYRDKNLVEKFTIENPRSTRVLIEREFNKIDTVKFVFREATSENRVHIRRVKVGDITDYVIDYRDMASSPVASRTDFVKNINVQYYEYAYGTEEKVISTISNVKETNVAEYKTPYHNFSLAYKELTDDDTVFTKASKKFVKELPAIDKAKTSTRYFVEDGTKYKVYMVKTEDKLNSWEFLETASQVIVDELPMNTVDHVLYLLRTDTLLIYHCYIRDITTENHPLVSLGYDVRGNLKIVDSSAYFVKFTTDVLSPIEVSGIQFIVTERSCSKKLNELGVDKTARNVLIDTEEWAEKEVDWLEEYYSNDVEYKITYRGEPSIDPDDQIYIENKFVSKNLIRVTETQINTTTGMSMSCTLNGRRISYEEEVEE